MGTTIDELQKYINALRQCAKEHDKDTTYTGHIIVSNLCRDTANLLEQLDQESKTDVFDRLRAEIANRCGINTDYCNSCRFCDYSIEIREILKIIDKYKAESEG